MSEQNYKAQIKQLEERIKTLESRAAGADLFFAMQPRLITAQLAAGASFVSALIDTSGSHFTMAKSNMGLFLELQMRTSVVLKEIIRALPVEHREKVDLHLKSLSSMQGIIEQTEADHAAIQKSLLEKLRKIGGDQQPPPPPPPEK